jgi:hypothetical protein
MGSGCSSRCNSKKNFLPRNVEPSQRYEVLSDGRKNRSKHSLHQPLGLHDENSSRLSSLLGIQNTNSNSNRSSTNSRFEEKLDHLPLTRGKSGSLSESAQKAENVEFSNSREDYADLMGTRSVTSSETKISCNQHGVDIDTMSADHCDSEAAKNALKKMAQENKPIHNDKNVHVEDNWKELDAQSDNVNNLTVNQHGGRLPTQKNSAWKPGNGLTSPCGRDRCLMEQDPGTRASKYCRDMINNKYEYTAKMIPAPFDEVSDMVIVSNPGISILPGAHSMKSDDYRGQASAEEYHNVKSRSLANRQPCSSNEVQQFWSKISNQKLCEGVQEFFNPGGSYSMKGDHRNSLAMMSDSAFFGEMDRCLAITPSDTDLDEFAPQDVGTAGAESSKNELSLIRSEHCQSIGNLFKTHDSLQQSKDNGAVIINKALELYKPEYNSSKSIPTRDRNDSFSDLEKRVFDAFDRVRKSSFLVDEEMSQNADNPTTVDAVGPPQSKMKMTGSVDTSPCSQATSAVNEVPMKRNNPNKNQKVEVDVDSFITLPSNTFSPESSSSESFPSQDGSASSSDEYECEGQICFKNLPCEEVCHEENSPLRKNDDYPSGQPDQTTTPEQTPPLTWDRNRELKCSFKSPSPPHKLGDVRKKRLIAGPFDYKIEYKENYEFSTPKRLTKEVSKWTVQDVEHWILGLNTEVRHYSEAFKTSQIDGERLTVLTEQDFSRFIPSKTHRYIVMNALEEICPSSDELGWESASGCFKRYQLKEMIKVGKFSTTHRALDLGHSKRICEVKLISNKKSVNLLPHPGIAAKEVALKEWLAKSSSMRHENMITYYDHCTDETYRGTLYKYVLVREHHQLNLELLVSNNIPLGEVISRRILQQIVSLLCFFRAKEIGHFDLQPANFLVKRDKWQIKLTEWSSFKQFTQKSTESEGAEELNYRGIYTAPEIYNNLEYGLVADSWSLGVVLFGLITGTVLFSSRNSSDSVYNALKQDSFNAFCNSLEEKHLSWPLLGITKTVIFSLVRYNANARLDILNVEDLSYYNGILPSDEEYASAMENAFQQCYRHGEC